VEFDNLEEVFTKIKIFKERFLEFITQFSQSQGPVAFETSDNLFISN